VFSRIGSSFILFQKGINSQSIPWDLSGVALGRCGHFLGEELKISLFEPRLGFSPLSDARSSSGEVANRKLCTSSVSVQEIGEA
jgi:hypothetical protein